jgi:hypothetical protein
LSGVVGVLLSFLLQEEKAKTDNIQIINSLILKIPFSLKFDVIVFIFLVNVILFSFYLISNLK